MTRARRERFGIGLRVLLGTAAILAAALPAGCKPPPDKRHVVDAHAGTVSPERGLRLIERTGCGACHEIPGLAWPRGRLGPSLMDFNEVGLIAGELPNTTENLASFIRNAPAIKPGSAMPPMPITPDEARDIAVYLYGTAHE